MTHGRVHWTAPALACLVALAVGGIAAFMGRVPLRPADASDLVLRSEVATDEVFAAERVGDLELAATADQGIRTEAASTMIKRPTKPPLPRNRRWHTWLSVLDAETGEPLSDVTLVSAVRNEVLVVEHRPSPIDVTAATRGRARSLPFERSGDFGTAELPIGSQLNLTLKVLVDGYVPAESTIDINGGGEEIVELRKGAKLVVKVLGKVPSKCRMLLYRDGVEEPVAREKATVGETFAYRHLKPGAYTAVLLGERVGTRDDRGRPLEGRFARAPVELELGSSKTVKLIADWKFAETNAAAE